MRLEYDKKDEGEQKGHRNLGKEPQGQNHHQKNPASCLFTITRIKPNESQKNRDKLF